MWKMIKADIEYNKTLFIFLYSVVFLAVLSNAIKGYLEEQLTMLMFFSVVVIGVTAGIEEIKTKRIRFFSGLPISVKRLGVFRYSVFVPYWLSLMVFLWFSSLVSQKAQMGLEYLWWILTRTGAVFIWIACMNLSQDFTFVYRSKGPGYALKWTVLLFGVFGGPLVYFATNPRYQSDPFFSFISDVFLSPTGGMGLFFLSLGLLAMSVLVYKKRKSYTE
ncbi:MAG: hypothetical protein JSV17_17555 [Candidatus Aminicenantes bacterium]|nr:MAG: hypothetical protein JSV17_17555 [Candidatus Aminicenantes bacterium]